MWFICLHARSLARSLCLAGIDRPPSLVRRSYSNIVNSPSPPRPPLPPRLGAEEGRGGVGVGVGCYCGLSVGGVPLDMIG